MGRWPRDNQPDLIRFYGEPGPEVEAQLVPVVPPFQMLYDGKPIRHIRFHKKAAPALKAALDEIWSHYGQDQRKIDQLGISKYAGAYNPRKIRGSATKWSNHAYGAAIDLNAAENGFGKGKGNIPQPVIDAFKRQGARWGGDYRGRTDPMHFEFCEAISRPIGVMGDPMAAGDSDSFPETEESEERPGFFRRVRNWVVGGLSTIGFGGLGAMTDWQVAAITFGFVLLLIIGTVTFIILFFGADKVRKWAVDQVT